MNANQNCAENATKNERESVTDHQSSTGEPVSESPSSRVKSQSVKTGAVPAPVDEVRAALMGVMADSTIRAAAATALANFQARHPRLFGRLHRPFFATRPHPVNATTPRRITSVRIPVRPDETTTEALRRVAEGRIAPPEAKPGGTVELEITRVPAAPDFNPIIDVIAKLEPWQREEVLKVVAGSGRPAPPETVTGLEPTEIVNDEIECETCGALAGQPCTEGGAALGYGLEHIPRVRRRFNLKPPTLRTDESPARKLKEKLDEQIPTCGGMTVEEVAHRIFAGDDIMLITPGRVPVDFMRALAERLRVNLEHGILPGDVRQRVQRLVGQLDRMVGDRATGHRLVPSIGFDRVAAVMLAGEPEHGDRWKTRTPKHHIAAAYRHLAKWGWGQGYDRDLYAQGHGKHSHLACAAARILMALHLAADPESSDA